jgi:hypothetical protein
MRRTNVLLVLLIIATVSTFAGTPIANVISAESIDVNGITAPARNYIPIELGGQVTTRNSSATIKFADGTTVVLQPNSVMKIDGKAGAPDIHLLQGSAQYKLSPGSRTHVSNGSDNLVDKLIDDTTASRSVAPAPPAAVVYRASSSKSTNVILPTSPTSTSGFLTVAPTTGTFILKPSDSIGAVTTGPQIVGPSGFTINLTPNGSGGYTVASISEVVNGVTVTTTTGPAIGATVSSVSTSTGTGSSVAITLTTSTGTAVPVTAIQQSVQAAVTTLAATTPALQTTTGAPVTVATQAPAATGNFSPSAP